MKINFWLPVFLAFARFDACLIHFDWRYIALTLLNYSCCAKGNPSIIQWYRDKKMIDDSFAAINRSAVENSLQINQLGRWDEKAILTCEAHNSNLTKPLHASVRLNMNCKGQMKCEWQFDLPRRVVCLLTPFIPFTPSPLFTHSFLFLFLFTGSEAFESASNCCKSSIESYLFFRWACGQNQMPFVRIKTTS